MPKVLIVTGDGGESYEALYALHRFQEEGWEAVVSAPSKRRLNLVIHDFKPGWDTYIERRGYGMESQITFDQIRVGDYEAVLLLGGRAPEYLRNHAQLLETMREFELQKKWIFAICHGVQVLAAAGLVDGKRLTCYEHVRLETEKAGAQWVAEEAVCDGRLITAQTWMSHPMFYREIFAHLRSKSDAARS